MNFELHPQLQKDSVFIAELGICQLRLINDSQYPWFILVPKMANVSEIIDLNEEQQQLLWQSSAKLSQVLQQTFSPKKLNVASIGNMVPQLHVHHIVRYESDAAWPRPVWGAHPMQAYDDAKLKQTISLIQGALLA